MAGKTTPRSMKLGTGMMLLGAALPVLTVELAKLPPSPVTRWASVATAVLGAMVVAYGHLTRPHDGRKTDARPPEEG